MKSVVFGLTISSSWGNGHATLWRALCRGLHALGHEVVFFERDVPYYAAHRDQRSPEGCDLRLYQEWAEVLPEVRRALRSADVGMVTWTAPIPATRRRRYSIQRRRRRSSTTSTRRSPWRASGPE